MIMQKNTCSKCNRVFPETSDYFHRDKYRRNGFSSQCRECRNKASSAWNKNNRNRRNKNWKKYYGENKNKRVEKSKKEYRNNPERAKDKRLLRKYGISLRQYKRWELKQGGCCAICKKEGIHRNQFGKRKQLVVDHDHATGKVRGLLCSSCNLLLGQAKNDTMILQKAISYLREYRHEGI